jgi:hypothetical protein
LLEFTNLEPVELTTTLATGAVVGEVLGAATTTGAGATVVVVVVVVVVVYE